MQNIEQLRAAHALDSVATLKAQKLKTSEVRSYVSAFPAQIHMNGLGQACAFQVSKGGTHKALYTVLESWLCGAHGPYQRFDGLMQAITESDMHTYRVAQAEAQAYLGWLKKLVRSEFHETDEQGGNQ